MNLINNLGKSFFKILHNRFPPQHHYYKIFNRNTVKLSYSTTPNLARNIASSNIKKLYAPPVTSTPISCNCTNPSACPLDRKCLTPNVVYCCSVSTPSVTKAYIGVASTSFKTRFNNHRHTLNNPNKRKATSLSSYVWDLKDASIPYQLRWSILTRAQPYSGSLRDCNLCSEEAIRILRAEYALLNKRSELVLSCRHFSRFTFAHYQPPPPYDNSLPPPPSTVHTHSPPRPPNTSHSALAPTF